VDNLPYYIETETAQSQSEISKKKKKRELADCQCKLMSTLIKAGNSGPLETPFGFPYPGETPQRHSANLHGQAKMRRRVAANYGKMRGNTRRITGESRGKTSKTRRRQIAKIIDNLSVASDHTNQSLTI